jgi:hypothetical protein
VLGALAPLERAHWPERTIIPFRLIPSKLMPARHLLASRLMSMHLSPEADAPRCAPTIFAQARIACWPDEPCLRLSSRWLMPRGWRAGLTNGCPMHLSPEADAARRRLLASLRETNNPNTLSRS